MLEFPNISRSYDPARHGVRFWGHDSALEISFFVTVDALRKLEPDMVPDEPSCLRVFDHHRPQIHAAAARAHAGRRQDFHELSARNL